MFRIHEVIPVIVRFNSVSGGGERYEKLLKAVFYSAEHLSSAVSRIGARQ